MQPFKCIICHSTPRNHQDVRNNPEYHGVITRVRVKQGSLTPLDTTKPIILCVRCYQIVQDVTQHPQSMSITDLLRNSNGPYTNTQNLSKSLEDSESLVEDASASEVSYTPPSTESLNIIPQSSESMTNTELPSLENDVVLHISNQTPAARQACDQVMNAPGPKSKKRQRALELLNSLSQEEDVQRQQLLDHLEAQNDDPAEAARFMKTYIKRCKPPAKRRRQREADSSSSSASGLIIDTSSSLAQRSQEPLSLMDIAEPSVAGPSEAVARPSQAVMSQNTPRAAQTAPIASASSQNLSSQSNISSSSVSSSGMRPPLSSNPHSNMAAPRRVNYDFPVPSSSTSREHRNLNTKNLGG